MSQQTNIIPNGPSQEYNTNFREGEVTQEASKILPDGKVNPNTIGYISTNQPRPPLLRIDSRSTIQTRPGFPNPQGFPPRPFQQVRAPPPGTAFAQRPPGAPIRPPFQAGQSPFPQNQNSSVANQPLTQNPPIRSVNPSVRPGTPFPRYPTARPAVVQQRSVPTVAPLRINPEQLPRSQTLDSSDVIEPRFDNGSFTTNGEDTRSTTVNSSINRTRKLSSDISDSNANSEDRRRSVESIGSLDDKKSIAGSNENLEFKSDKEDLSRPESRASSRMNKIVEDEDKIYRADSPTPLVENTQQKVEFKITAHDNTTALPSTTGNGPSFGESKIEAHQSSSNELSEGRIRSGKYTVEKPANIKSLDLNNLAKSKSPARSEGDNDSGVDESTQGNDQSSNGDHSPRKSGSKISKRISSSTPRSLSRGSKSPSLKSPDSAATTPGAVEKKKIPMNKVQVGSAPSPNLKVVRSKIGSLENTSYKPGGGNVKIESKKIEFKNTGSRIEAKNEKYVSKGGDKKIQQQKLQWNAKPKIGSLENASHKPKGGDKKIESLKVDFKDKAKPKVCSKDNMKHVPGGGDVKFEEVLEETRPSIESRKIDVKVQSKVGSLGNMKHKPGGGDKKIFDDKEYLKQKSTISGDNQSLSGSQADYLYTFY